MSNFHKYLEATNPGTHTIESKITTMVAKYIKNQATFSEFVDLLEEFRISAFNEGYESSAAWPRGKNEDFDQKVGPPQKPDEGKPISPTARFVGNP